MHQVSKPRAANQSITEESGRPGTRRSNVGCDAIDEPCTNSTVPAGRPAARFSQRKRRTSPLSVQCSWPRTLGAAACSFMGNSNLLRRCFGRVSKDTALRAIHVESHRIADREALERMGLHPQHLAGGQGRIIFADIAEKDMIADRGGGHG